MNFHAKSGVCSSSRAVPSRTCDQPTYRASRQLKWIFLKPKPKTKHVSSEMPAGKDWVPAPFLLFRNHLIWVTVFCSSRFGGQIHHFCSHGDFLHALLCNETKNSVRVPPLSLRGYEGWATCGQNSLTGSPQDSLTSFFTQFLFSDLGFSFLWTRVPQLTQSWYCFLGVFAGNIEGTVHRSIDL